MTDCTTCGNQSWLCQRCKMDELEDRLGLPSENEVEIQYWVQDLEKTFHASMYFEGSRHVAACGTILETPVADLTEDPNRFRDEADCCEDCMAALEDDSEATVPDGGEFERATELRADGGLLPARIDYDDLIGSECPQCGEEMTPGAIRFAGNWWEHQSSNTHPQAGHHQISEILEVEGVKDEDREVATDGGLEEVYRRETIIATDDGIAIGEDAAPEAGRDD